MTVVHGKVVKASPLVSIAGAEDDHLHSDGLTHVAGASLPWPVFKRSPYKRAVLGKGLVFLFGASTVSPEKKLVVGHDSTECLVYRHSASVEHAQARECLLLATLQ